MRKFVLPLLAILLFSCSKENQPYITISGNAFGTTYSITYEDNKQQNFEKSIDSIIYVMNRSLSTYLPNSDISKINSGDSLIEVDENFIEVFQKSEKIYKETDGFFDPTVGVLVNAWGFGPEDFIEDISQAEIDSLMEIVGFNKVSIKNGKVIKQHPNIYFDFNAVAKGFGIDLMGRFLEQNACENYLIELGGEIRSRGLNSKGLPWKVAIEDPNTDGTRSYSNIISLTNESMASSGNYRKFKIDRNGKKFVHTINPTTGYATESDLLGATVIASLDCADVDAYATAFMAMGFEKTKDFLENHSNLKAYLIYFNDSGELQTYTTPTLKIEPPE